MSLKSLQNTLILHPKLVSNVHYLSLFDKQAYCFFLFLTLYLIKILQCVFNLFLCVLQMENAKVYAAPYVLCHPIPMPPSDSADENATSLQALAQNASVLYCGYCLSHDDNYLLAVCTDSVGELIESCVITVEKCLRPDGRPRKTPARTKALIKLWEFCQGVVATSLVPWRLVVSKLGRIGPEELKGENILKEPC